jgi:hypothetical protein
MFVDPAVVGIAVRTTARISAVLLAANLITAARRVSRGRQFVSPARQQDLATFVAFLVSHTIHFACVALLAFATAGENVRTRGGWGPALAVAAVFYLGGWSVLRGKRRPGPGWTSGWHRWREIAVLLAIWLVFFQAFASRAGTPVFAVLSGGLLYAVVRFLSVALKSPAGASPAARASV